MNIKLMNTMAFAAALAASSVVAATEWIIPTGDVVALTNALTKYAANDIITLAAGTYNLAGVQMSAGYHLITHGNNSGLTLRGHAADDTILLGGGQDDGLSILGVRKDCIASNLTFTGGWRNGGSGGAVCFVTGKYSVFRDCVISNNHATANGGAAYFQKFYNCLFENNSTASGGGAISYAIASNCVFRGNTATKQGSAVYQNTGVPLIDCKFFANKSESYYTLQSSLGAIDCEFICNTNYAGGVLNGDYATNCIFRGNYGKEGCAVYNATASGCHFESNYTTVNGVAKKARLYDCVFIANTNIYAATSLVQESVPSTRHPIHTQTALQKLRLRGYAITSTASRGTCVHGKHASCFSNNRRVRLRAPRGNDRHRFSACRTDFGTEGRGLVQLVCPAHEYRGHGLAARH